MNVETIPGILAFIGFIIIIGVIVKLCYNRCCSSSSGGQVIRTGTQNVTVINSPVASYPTGQVTYTINPNPSTQTQQPYAVQSPVINYIPQNTSMQQFHRDPPDYKNSHGFQSPIIGSPSQQIPTSPYLATQDNYGSPPPYKL